MNKSVLSTSEPGCCGNLRNVLQHWQARTIIFGSCAYWVIPNSYVSSCHQSMHICKVCMMCMVVSTSTLHGAIHLSPVICVLEAAQAMALRMTLPGCSPYLVTELPLQLCWPVNPQAGMHKDGKNSCKCGMWFPCGSTACLHFNDGSLLMQRRAGAAGSIFPPLLGSLHKQSQSTLSREP